MKMFWATLTKAFFGWDWACVSQGYGVWKMQRIRKLFDGRLYYWKDGRPVFLSTKEDIGEIWITCARPEVEIKKS